MPAFPLTLPAAPGFSRCSLRVRRVVARSESVFTLQSQVFEHPGARWEAEVTVPQHNNAAWAWQWSAFVAALRGQAGTFLMGDPSRAVPRGAAGVSAALSIVTATAGANSVVLGGFTASQAGALLAGDHLQIGTGAASRLHMVVADAGSDGAGQALVEIEPPLRTAHGAGTPVSLNAPRGVWRLAVNDLGWEAEPGLTPPLTLPCVEAL